MCISLLCYLPPSLSSPGRPKTFSINIINKICSYLIVVSDWRLVALVEQLKHAHVLLRLAFLLWVSVHSSYYEIMHALGAASEIINIVVEALIFDSILADVHLLSLVHMRSHTDGCRDLHGHHTVLRVDIIVVLLFLFFVFHDFPLEGLHEGEELLRLLVSEQDPYRFEAKELREESSHVFEQLREGALCADQGREFDAHHHLFLGHLALMLRFQLVQLELDESHNEGEQLILYRFQMLPMRFLQPLAFRRLLTVVF